MTSSNRNIITITNESLQKPNISEHFSTFQSNGYNRFWKVSWK